MNTFTVTIRWTEGDPTIMRNDTEIQALQWAAYYYEKALNPEHGIVAVSVSQA